MLCPFSKLAITALQNFLSFVTLDEPCQISPKPYCCNKRTHGSTRKHRNIIDETKEKKSRFVKICIADTEYIGGISLCGRGKQTGGLGETVGPGVCESWLTDVTVGDIDNFHIRLGCHSVTWVAFLKADLVHYDPSIFHVFDLATTFVIKSFYIGDLFRGMDAMHGHPAQKATSFFFSLLAFTSSQQVEWITKRSNMKQKITQNVYYL